MKKVLVLLLLVFCVFGCSMNESSTSAVKNYLNRYGSLNNNVVSEIRKHIPEEYSNEQKLKYEDILKKQYSDMKYEIISEEKDGEVTYVTTKVEVYDLSKSMDESDVYLNDHQDEFMTDGVYDNDKFINHKLDSMKKETSRIEHEIIFTVTKDENGKYEVTDLTETDIQKLHGIY